eukprot:TRINITY_DN11924_c0_g2_i1.p1 TRINITY_DN11924_c0_g2~~TRINITY_DN11924_c0_g2_i1.p1  ORF type:complete len:651 (-),score=202.16 TRINITY_DN11924_c0_g2_i1:76-2007(-)
MADTDRLVNCHFSVNQQALATMVRPLVTELMADLGLSERLRATELGLTQLRENIAMKAESAGLEAVLTELHEHRQQLQQKASQATVAATQAQLRSLESTLAWKADQSGVEEQAKAIESANKLAASKADASALNRAVVAAQKLQAQVSANEKQLQEVNVRLQKLEMHNLPVNVQKMSEQSNKSRDKVQRCQELLATKADSDALEALCSQCKELEASLALKAGPQTVQELRSAIRDLQLKVDLKADMPVLEEQRAELRKLVSQISMKAEQQELRQTAVDMCSIRANLDQKVDSPKFGDLRSRLQVLESSLEQKAMQKDILEVTMLKDSLALKADRRQVSELSSQLERLQMEISARLESDRSAWRRDAEASAEKLNHLSQELQQALGGNSLALREVQASRSSLALSGNGPAEAPAVVPQQQATVAAFASVGQELATREVAELGKKLREVMAVMDDKASRPEMEALAQKVQEFRVQLLSALETLPRKVDRAELEELLSAAASAAAVELSEEAARPIDLVPSRLPEHDEAAALQAAMVREDLGAHTPRPCQISLDRDIGAADASDGEQPRMASTRSSGTLSGALVRSSGALSGARSHATLSPAHSVEAIAMARTKGRRGVAAEVIHDRKGAPVYPAKGTRLAGMGWRA